MDDEEILNLSDEDLDKMGYYPPSSSVSEEQESEGESEEESDDTEQLEEQEEESPESDEDEAEESEVEDAAESTDDAPEDDEDESEEDEGENNEEEGEEQEEEKLSDAEAFYKALTAPIKAIGKEHNITDPEEARKFIQMGIGYTKRLESLKPARQVFKTLEQNNMLDNDSIGFAIDLVNGNKDAILKLLKEKSINPLDLDIDSDNAYQPTTGLVPEQSVEFDDIMADIRGSEYANATTQTVQKWDAQSRAEVRKKPQIIADLHHHMETGVYDKVSAMVDKQVALGNPQLRGLSDLERYNVVGNWMAQEGHLAPPSAGEQSTSDLGEKVLPKAGKDSNPKTVKKKKAAGIPRSKPASTPKAVNPLDMDDAEFDEMLRKFS